MAIWPIFLKRTLVTSKTVNVSLEHALNAVQDPPTLIRLNPLVIGYDTKPDDPSHYIIADRLKVMGMDRETKYAAKFSSQPDGMISVVRAGGGVNLKNHWRVRVSEGGEVEIIEEVTVEALFLLMPYVMGQLRSSHQIIVNKLAAKLEGTEALPAIQQVGKTGKDGTSVNHMSLLHPGGLHFTSAVGSRISGNLTAMLIIFSSLAIIVNSHRSTPSDPYGSFHLSLNRLPGEDPAKPPQTEWLNMGYWKNANNFPEACEALCLKLVQAARLSLGSRVLDVGHGTGESLILLLSHPSVPRPLSVTGITSLRAHHDRSLRRVDRLHSEPSVAKSQPTVDLYHGDAVYRPPIASHPLDPSSATPTFDCILALDCAYHFETRKDFLQQAFHRLSPGGRIALADICLPTDAYSGGGKLFLLSLKPFIPRDNMLSVEEYVETLREVGYMDIEIEDITADVFPGFRAFLKSMGWNWSLFEKVLGLYVDAGARFVVVTGAKPLTQ